MIRVLIEVYPGSLELEISRSVVKSEIWGSGAVLGRKLVPKGVQVDDMDPWECKLADKACNC